MTPEEKQLLLKDLCARLTYGFTIYRLSDNANIKISDIDVFAHFLEYSEGEEFKPYLRPMSSMTEEERNEWMEITHAQEWLIIGNLDKATDWLNKNGFDYRGLIPMGLAIEAPEGMYMSYSKKHPATEDIIKKRDESIRKYGHFFKKKDD